MVKSSWAWAAAASAICIVPLTVGDPVTEVPGLNPRSPLIVVGAMLVTVEAASSANVEADPRATGAGPANVSELRAGELGLADEIGNPMLLESRVTAAVRANSRPSTAAPVV